MAAVGFAVTQAHLYVVFPRKLAQNIKLTRWIYSLKVNILEYADTQVTSVSSPAHSVLMVDGKWTWLAVLERGSILRLGLRSELYYI